MTALQGSPRFTGFIRRLVEDGIVSTENMQAAVNSAKKANQDIVPYLIENLKLKPIVIAEKISEEFMKEVLYDNIRFLKDKQIPILDYWKDDRLNDYKLYINSDFLNEKGSKLFTEIVLEDIKKLDKA